MIGFEYFEQAADFTPMYRGLPDDRCQSHHWGYVIKGRMIVHRPDGDIVAERRGLLRGPRAHGRDRPSRTPRSWSSAPLPSTTRRWRLSTKNMEAAAGGG